MSNGITIDFRSPCNQYLLTFEDNGRVAYAYLKEIRNDNNIVGYVWLYNRCQTPFEPEWTDQNKIPFAISQGYAYDGARMNKKIKVQDVLVDWEYEENNPVAYVYLFEDLYGVIGVGDKPGYARYVSHSSPLAKVMEIED